MQNRYRHPLVQNVKSVRYGNTNLYGCGWKQKPHNIRISDIVLLSLSYKLMEFASLIRPKHMLRRYSIFEVTRMGSMVNYV